MSHYKLVSETQSNGAASRRKKDSATQVFRSVKYLLLYKILDDIL